MTITTTNWCQNSLLKHKHVNHNRKLVSEFLIKTCTSQRQQHICAEDLQPNLINNSYIDIANPYIESQKTDYNLNPLPKISVGFLLTEIPKAIMSAVECARLFILDQILW